MFLFNIFKSKGKVAIKSHMKGNIIPTNQLQNSIFKNQILGTSVSISPSLGRVVAPLDGMISTIFFDNFFITIKSELGVEILINLEIDDINLQKDFFNIEVQEGDKVKEGDLLFNFDMDYILNKGYKVTSNILIINHLDYKNFNISLKKNIDFNEDLILMYK